MSVHHCRRRCGRVGTLSAEDPYLEARRAMLLTCSIYSVAFGVDALGTTVPERSDSDKDRIEGVLPEDLPLLEHFIHALSQKTDIKL
jgi:hypothetical protein